MKLLISQVFFYLSYFNVSKIVAQLSDYKDISRKETQEKSITGVNIDFNSSNMKAHLKRLV